MPGTSQNVAAETAASSIQVDYLLRPAGEMPTMVQRTRPIAKGSKRQSAIERLPTDIDLGLHLETIAFSLSEEAMDRIFAAAHLPVPHVGADLVALRDTLESVVATVLEHGMKKLVDRPSRDRYAAAFAALLKAYAAARLADDRPPPELPRNWVVDTRKWIAEGRVQMEFWKAPDGSIGRRPSKEGRPRDRFDGTLYQLLLDLYAVAYDREPGITRDADSGPAVRFLFAFHKEMAAAMPQLIADMQDRLAAQNLARRWAIPKVSTLKSKVRNHGKGPPVETLGIPEELRPPRRRMTYVRGLFEHLRKQEPAKTP